MYIAYFIVFFILFFKSRFFLANFFFFFLDCFYCSLFSNQFFLLQHLQFLSNLAQYSSSYLLSVYPYNFLTTNLPSNSPLLNVPFSLSCLLISFISLLYSFSNSSTVSFVFPRFSFPFQVSDSIVNPFHHTRYLFFSLIHCLFNILSTSYSFSSSIITGADCSFLCSSTCPIYLHILLTLTTRCILIVAGSSNSTAFIDTISLIL